MSLPRLLTVEEVATYLRLSAPTVRAMLRRGEIPGARLGGAWRVSEFALNSFFESQELHRVQYRGKVAVPMRFPTAEAAGVVVPRRADEARDVRVLAVLQKKEFMRRRQVAAAAGMNNLLCAQTLERLTDSRLVLRIGVGTSGNPYCYRLAEPQGSGRPIAGRVPGIPF